MFSVKWWLDAAYTLWVKFCGPKVIREHRVSQNLYRHLTGYAVAGYEIQFFCHKRSYQRCHALWFIPNRRYFMFRVFCVVSNDAPRSLRNACELELDLPLMTPRFVSEHLQKETAVQAYLDILIGRLKLQHLPVKI
jgi:hypothetical protein